MEKNLAFCNNRTAGCLADSDVLKEPEEDARKLRGNFHGKTGPREHREAPTDGERQHEDMKRDLDGVVG